MSGARRRSASDATARPRLSQLLSGASLVHAVSVAASLGVADLLERGPRTAAALAKATATHEESLYRLLRTLSAVGVFAERRGRFALTPISNLLRTHKEGSMRSVAELAGAPSRRAAFDLAYSVRTGKPAFDRAFGMSFFDYLDVKGPERRLFGDVMTYHWRTTAATVLERYDFSRARTIVDVGGGSGALIESILSLNTRARGIVVETPAVARETRRRIRSVGLAARCRVVNASFFHPLPTGGEIYILAFVLHNWGDREATAILRQCRRAMGCDGRVLAIESPLDGSSFAAIHDLEMLLYMGGGRERSVAEYRRLFRSAGLSVRRVVPTTTTARLIEAVQTPTA